ncbi:MAG: type IV pilus assembly protein PilM [Armatimonadetes bacterium]|nr:type IV pilus assembly protein PilM [Armatimonadota bacterium]MDI9602072.1 type IV pilus assembly protein PilM [Acidobacteriota bacterium]NLN89714.1 type IV pilus assembly protein PilM [candidate division WS1 bacterium]
MAGSLLGIDVGCSTIKLAELSGGPGSLKLVGLAVGPTPRDAYDAGTILDAQALGKAIAALMSQHRIGARRAAVALSGTENCGLRVQEYPSMPEKELKGTIKQDAERLFPFQSDLQYGYQVIGQGAGDTVEVVVAGARKQYVVEWCKVLAEAKLQPVYFDLAMLANVIAMVEAAGTHRRERCLMVIDIGQRTSTISIVRDGALRFVRTTEEASGQKLTDAVRLEVKPDTEAEAEQIKLAYGSVSLEAGQQDTYYEDDFLSSAPLTAFTEEVNEQELVISVDDAATGDDTLVLSAQGGADDLFGDLGAPTTGALFGTEVGDATEDMDSAEAAAPGHEPLLPPPPEPEASAPVEAPIDDFVLDDDMSGAAAQSDESYTRQVVGQALVEPLALLAGEVRRTMEYYRSRHTDADIERIVLLGGTALLPNLSEFMERELGVPVEVGDPLVAVAVDHSAYPPDQLKAEAPKVAAAVGMAAREIL